MIRAAWLAAVWAMVAAVIAAASVGAVVLIGAAVAAISGFFGNSVALSETTRRITFIGGGIAVCGVIVASTWAAAYASTRAGSRWRMLAGSAVGVALGLGLVGLGSLGAPAAALAGGWGVAIPSDRVERAVLRSLPLAIVALLPALAAEGTWVTWLVASVAGVGGAWIWITLAEGIWAGLAKISTRYRPIDAIMQNKTQGVRARRTSLHPAGWKGRDENTADGNTAEREESWRAST